MDYRKCQTATATPPKAGDLLLPLAPCEWIVGIRHQTVNTRSGLSLRSRACALGKMPIAGNSGCTADHLEFEPPTFPLPSGTNSAIEFVKERKGSKIDYELRNSVSPPRRAKEKPRPEREILRSGILLPHVPPLSIYISGASAGHWPRESAFRPRTTISGPVAFVAGSDSLWWTRLCRTSPFQRLRTVLRNWVYW